MESKMQGPQTNQEGNTLVTFQAISKFVDDLNTEFGKKNKSLALYHRLISRTTITHEESINKHIDIFKAFITINKQAIQDRKYQEFNPKTLSYIPDTVYIDMEYIFTHTDAETHNAIWKHLLTISGLIDPTSEAREILKKLKEQSPTGAGSNEFNMISNLFEKMQTQLGPNDKDPATAITKLMQSGVFTELLTSMQSGMQSGSINPASMLSAVQGMASQNGAQAPDLSGIMGMVSTIMPAMMGSSSMNPSDLKSLDNMSMDQLQKLAGPGSNVPTLPQ